MLRTLVPAVSLVVVAGVAAAPPAAAAADTCKTVLRGGIVGGLVIGSSHDVYGIVPDHEQRAHVDLLTVNFFGAQRYRLASDVELISWRSGSTFVGGAGAYVGPESLELSDRFLRCLEKKTPSGA